MRTSVIKEILFHSIDGSKIYGGNIDLINSLTSTNVLADFLRVPITGSNGTGSIDGNGYTIGSSAYISSVRSESIQADNDTNNGSSIIVRSANHDSFKVETVSGHAAIGLYNGLSGAQTHFFHPFNNNYIDAVLLVGATSPLQGSTALQVDGNVFMRDGWIDELGGGGLLLSDWYSSFLAAESDINNLQSFVSGYPTNISSLTNSEVTQLANINSATISNSQWINVQNMQPVGSGGNVTFGTVTAVLLTSSAQLDITSQSGSDVVIQGVFRFLTNDTFTYTAPGSGVQLYSDILGTLHLRSNINTAGIRVNNQGDTYLNLYPGGTGIGLFGYGETLPAKRGSIAIYAVGNGLRLFSDTENENIYCKTSETGNGWEVDNNGRVNVVTEASANGGFGIGGLAAAQIKYIVEALVTPDLGSGHTTPFTTDHLLPGAFVGDSVFVHMSKDGLTGDDLHFTYEAYMTGPNNVTLLIIPINGMTVDIGPRNVTFTAISYL